MTDKMSHGKIILILIAIAYFFLMAGNGLISLTHPDEVFYIQTAKEMLAHRSFMTPYIFDQPQFEKPILTYWLLMLSIKLFGMTAFAARFWPALFGIIGVVATYGLGFMLFKNKRIAFLSAFVLSTNIIYLVLSRAVLTDMIFSIWVVLSLIFFYYGHIEQKNKNIGIILCFVFSGLAVLTKGLLGFVFPAAVILSYLIYKKDWTYFNNRTTFLGIFLFIVIAVPWHILMIKQYGQGFIDEYFKNVHMRRIFEAEHQKSNTWYFYLVTMIGGIFPWSLFLFPAGYLIYKSFKNSNPDRDRIFFLLIWITVIIFIMQIAQSKLASYIFPVFPAIAVLVGYYFNSILDSKNNPKLQRSMQICSYLMSALMILVSVVVIILSRRYITFLVHVWPFYIFSVLSLCCSAAIFIFNKRAQYAAVIGSLSSVILIILALAFLGYSYAEPWVSCREICNVFNKMNTKSSTVLCSKFLVRGVRFYTNRDTAVIDNNGVGFFSPHPVPFLNSDDKILNFFNNQSTTYCIVKKGDVKDIERIIKGRFKVTSVDEIGGKYLLIVSKI